MYIERHGGCAPSPGWIKSAKVGTGLFESEHRLCDARQGLWRVRQRADRESGKTSGPAIKKAIEVVKIGERALIDVVTQPR